MPNALRGPIAVLLFALVAWAFIQLSGPWGLPLGLTVAVGAVCGAALVAAWLRERRIEGTGPADGSDPDAPRFFAFEVSAKTALWTVVALVAIALGLRLHGLLDLHVWEDEMWTLRNTYSSDIGELLRVAFDDYWPPLHYLILNAVARVGDTSIVWLRAPSVLFGTLTVAAMYWLGRDLFGRRTAGLLAAALLTGMTSHVLYSQEARVYALQVLLVVLSARFFYRSFQERRISPAFLVTTTLLTYSHSFATWYFISGQCAYVAVAWLIWRDGEQFKKGFLSQLAVLLLWMPLVGAFVYSRLARDIIVPTYWATGPQVSMGLFDIVELYQALVVRSWAGAAFTALLFALALLPFGAWWRARSRSGSGVVAPAPAIEADDAYVRAVVFLLCWIAVPVAFSYVVTAATSLDTFGAPRYHLTVLPALCLLMTAGVATIRSRVAFSAVLLLSLLLPAAQLKRHYRDFPSTRPDVRAAAAVVLTHGTPDELVYIGPTFRVFAYYERESFPKIGSAEWDRLAATHAHLTDVYTMESVKYGDTYAYEKIDPRIRYIGWYGAGDVGKARYIEEQLAAGGFDHSFWAVVDTATDTVLREALDGGAVACPNRTDYDVHGFLVVHCGADGAASP